MKNSKKTFESAGQSANEVKKSHKHDANLQKNTTLYFQIGLILCLLGTYSLLEMQFQEKKLIPDRDEVTNVAQVEIPPFFEVEPDKPKKVEPVKERSTYLANEVKEVENDVTVTETKVITPDKPVTISEPVEVSDVKPIERPVDIPDVGFIHVEKVPVYPGCERKKTNDEKRKCMSAKITKLVNKKFN